MGGAPFNLEGMMAIIHKTLKLTQNEVFEIDWAMQSAIFKLQEMCEGFEQEGNSKQQDKMLEKIKLFRRLRNRLEKAKYI